jgi:hypothetical protein
MTSTGNVGRLGNHIIRNLAVSLLAEKHDLKVRYFNHSLIKRLGIELHCGRRTYAHTQELTDENYMTIYHGDLIHYNLDPNQHFFQTKDITRLIHQHLHEEKVKSRVMEKNPFQGRYHTNNDVFLHLRLTDVAHYHPGIAYYRNGLKDIAFDTMYVSTDDPHHPMVRELLGHPSAKLLDYDEITTFQFASTCKHVMLSHGSFSAIIGYLSFFSTVYYPAYEEGKVWYGDMFSIDGWMKICP